MSIRKSSVIQERVNLISAHMYKQYLDYNHAMINTKETFVKMADIIESVVDYLKQNFVSRGVPTENIYFEKDENNSVIILNILWHSISFTTRYNLVPRAINRGKETSPLFAGRILACRGNFNEIVAQGTEEEKTAFFVKEVASLYVPPDKGQDAIVTIRHLDNKPFLISQIDAPREFLLKVIETICGGGLLHEENKPL